MAPEAQVRYDELKEQGFIHITLLISGPPATWAEDYGLTYAVVDDNAETLWVHYNPGGTVGLPNFTILDRELRIRSWYEEAWVNDSLIDQLMALPAPEVDYPLPDDEVLVGPSDDGPTGGQFNLNDGLVAGSPYGGTSCSHVPARSLSPFSLLALALFARRRR